MAGNGFVQRRLQRWQNNRQPRAECEALTQRNLYILPTGHGFHFIGVAGLVWLLGTNYENNLVLMLAFLLAAIFVTSIFATPRNLEGLQIQVGDTDPVFAGQDLEVPLILSNDSRVWRRQVQVRYGERDYSCDVAPLAQDKLSIRVPTQQRGWQQFERMRVRGTFPLDLFSCWSWPCLRGRLLVYPKPVPRPISREEEQGEGRGAPAGRGIDDFAGLEEWRPGVSPQRIAWKQYSAGRGMFEKRFEAVACNPAWIDFEHYSGLGVEERLSAMCAKALEMESLGQSYGLKLGRQRIAPAQGERHLRELLTSLALYGETDERQ